MNADAVSAATDVVMHLRDTGLLQSIGEQIGQGIVAGAIRESEAREQLDKAAPALADALENLLAVVDRDTKEVHAARDALRLAGRIK